jgi:Flp pilus assembly pilin Flp
MRRLFKEFLWEDTGQDVIEYALTAALVGITAIATWQLIENAVNAFYSGRTSPAGPIQTLSGCTPNPGGGGC